MRALVFESEPLLAWMIEEILLEHGVTAVDLVWSELQAIAAAERNRPDVLIANLDITNGSVIPAVRSICAESDISVIFVTVDARSGRGVLPNAAVVEKPFAAQDLIEALEGCLLKV